MYEFWWVFAFIAATCAVLYLLGLVVKNKFTDGKDSMFAYNYVLYLIGVFSSMALIYSTGMFS